MSVPNTGPELWTLTDNDAVDAQRRCNPALIIRGEQRTDGMRAATTRAATVSHRFGGVRYALTRKDGFRPGPSLPDDGGDSHARH
ncbi:hypothetical protein Ahu01nite_034410 [Winogradskya humida]|uniref:Uncharacterized protein n=1 Tax=Winogradskya humida TaxID=113566 RepID=A0ABQ3ZPA1_9ACTN|nr:hypothetical protein Ahu01nite_034410 [Actinoplanes humidus]